MIFLPCHSLVTGSYPSHSHNLTNLVDRQSDKSENITSFSGAGNNII